MNQLENDSVSIVESRVLLTLLLLGGGLLLAFAALLQQPEGNHDAAKPAVAVGDVHAPVAATEVVTNTTEEHTVSSIEPFSTSEASHGAEAASAEGGEQIRPPLATDDNSSNSFLSANLKSLNLASPRLTTTVIALSILMSAGLAFRQSVGTLAVALGIGLFGVAVGLHEALHAGEESGIFVPLPALAAVLYGGAACLAWLVVAEARLPGRRTSVPD